MRNFNLSILLVIIVIPFHVRAQEKSGLDQFDWLLGTWMEKSEQGVFYESWIKKDHNTYFGLGAYISKGDTVLKEKLELHKTADHIVYIATVNKNIPVLFTLVSSSDRSWLFENKEHDFPQRINYNNMGSGKLYVKVSGIKDGKEVVEEIRAKKTITMRK